MVTDLIGPVEPGELVALEYKGEREFTNKDGRRVTSPDYRTLRKPANPTSMPEPPEPSEGEQPQVEDQADDDIPF